MSAEDESATTVIEGEASHRGPPDALGSVAPTSPAPAKKLRGAKRAASPPADLTNLSFDDLVSIATQNSPKSEAEAIRAIDLLIGHGESAESYVRQVWDNCYWNEVRDRTLRAIADFDTTEPDFLPDQIREGWAPWLQIRAAELLQERDPRLAHIMLARTLTTSSREALPEVVEALSRAPFADIGLTSLSEAEYYWRAYMENISNDRISNGIVDALERKTDDGVDLHSDSTSALGDRTLRDTGYGPPSVAELKVRSFLAVASDIDWFAREHVIETDLARAVSPKPEERAKLGRVVIDTVMEWGTDEPRLVELAAGTLCGLFSGAKPAGRNLASIGISRLDFVVERRLRAEIGGMPALQPVFDQFKDEIRKPLDSIAERAEEDWGAATRAAQFAFVTSMVLSIIVFLVGFAIAAFATYQVASGDATDATLGEGISLASGVATMVAAFYAGPLRNIRSTLHDRGVAHIAFATYIHRLRFLSVFYADEQSQGKMTPELLREIGQGLDTAAQTAAAVLRSTDEPEKDAARAQESETKPAAGSEAP